MGPSSLFLIDDGGMETLAFNLLVEAMASGSITLMDGVKVR